MDNSEDSDPSGCSKKFTFMSFKTLKEQKAYYNCKGISFTSGHYPFTIIPSTACSDEKRQEV